MSTLYILCGPSGCGKSTWRDEFIKDYNNRIHYVSRDEIRFSLVKEGEDYFSKEKEVFDRFSQALAAELMNGFDVIADATHINKASRNKLIKAIDKFFTEYQIVYVIFQTDLKTCIEQNNKRTGRMRVPEETIKKMFKNFQLPNLDEDNRIIGSIEVI